MQPRTELTGAPSALAVVGVSNKFPGSGNVGIGTLSPSAKLDVNGTSEFHGRINTGQNWISGDNGNEGIKILNNGNVGIGISPTTRLHVNGTSKFTGIINTSQQWISGDGAAEGIQIANSGTVKFNRTINTNNQWISGDGGAEGIHIDNNGWVSIGTNDHSKAQLQIEGVGPLYTTIGNKCGYLNNDGGSGGANPCGTREYSLYADNNLVAGTIFAWSDARIKDIRGISDASKDLETLQKIEVTDYQYKDKLAKGDQLQKKVIAQQVADVFPQAVDPNNTGVVPDIMQTAEISEGWVELTDHGLKEGEIVRLIFEYGKKELKVISSNEHAFQVESDQHGSIFVYGRQVNDFHDVDYDAIAMLNVSATQELTRKVAQLEKDKQTLQQENQQLRSEMGNLKQQTQSELNTLTNRLLKLENLMTGSAHR